MSSRKTPVYLSVAAKCDAIRMKDSGESVDSIMELYGITRSTFYKMYARREDIERVIEISTMGSIHSARRISLRHRMCIEEIVFRWYLRCKERRIQMTRAEIQGKALEIHEKLNGHPGFRASCTWMKGFQDRYRITNEDITEVSSTVTDHRFVEASAATFNTYLRAYGHSLKNVYNVVYAALVWKAVPKKTLIWKRAKLTGNLKMCQDHVITLLCANATGCHKLPILIIGNVPDTESLYSFDPENFPIIYKPKTNVCMDSTIFTQWYKEHFLESVKIRQERENGRRETCLLLVDNARLCRNLQGIDPLVTIMAPPPIVAKLIQPMNCGIITCFKRKYRTQLLEAIIPVNMYNTEGNAMEVYKKLNMWDCCRIAHTAWLNVDDAILIHSWDDLLRNEIMEIEEYRGRWEADVSKAVQILHHIPGCEMCGKSDVLSWYHIDNDDNIVKKICTDEALGEFENHNLHRHLNIHNIEHQAGPSHS